MTMEHVALIGRAKRTLEQVANASLATVTSDGRPWNSPLFVAFDSDFRFYWSSHRDAVHSTNIAARPDVFLVIFDSTQPDESGAAVYVRATARELLDGPAIQVGLEDLAKRKNERKKASADFMEPHPRRVERGRARNDLDERGQGARRSLLRRACRYPFCGTPLAFLKRARRGHPDPRRVILSVMSMRFAGETER